MRNHCLIVILLVSNFSCGHEPFSFFVDAGIFDTNKSSDTVDDTDDDDTDDDELVDTDTDTLINVDTETVDTETEGRCPWECRKTTKPPDFSCEFYELPDKPPTWIHNWDFDEYCEVGTICCQPIGIIDEGALTEYCMEIGDPVKCREEHLNTCEHPYPAYCWTPQNICCTS